jgi:hypothetical protein
VYGDVMAGFDEATRVEVDAAEQRHAARRCAAGEPGW